MKILYFFEEAIQLFSIIIKVVRLILGLKQPTQAAANSLIIGYVNDANFARICQVRDLESLIVEISAVEDKGSIAMLDNLKNLKNLKMDDGTKSELPFWTRSIFGQLQLLKLQTLKLTIGDELDVEFFYDLGHG